MSNEETNEDRDPSNVLLRAGYLHGMSARAERELDREFLLKAARSLIEYARALGVDVKVEGAKELPHG